MTSNASRVSRASRRRTAAVPSTTSQYGANGPVWIPLRQDRQFNDRSIANAQVSAEDEHGNGDIGEFRRARSRRENSRTAGQSVLLACVESRVHTASLVD